MQVINTLKSRLLRKGFAIQAIAYNVKTQTGVVHAKIDSNTEFINKSGHVVWWFDQDSVTYSGDYSGEMDANKKFLLHINDSF